jgi:hypothetical protein
MKYLCAIELRGRQEEKGDGEDIKDRLRMDHVGVACGIAQITNNK